jgi:hypothetical protein
VAVEGTPPVLVVLACTTALFDGIGVEGIGETLLERPRGPIAYWGATRICHPLYNLAVGEALAQRIGAKGGRVRLGPLFDAARDAAFEKAFTWIHKLLANVEDPARLMPEGARMYMLLGDPALELALPAPLGVEARVEGDHVVARATGDLPAGTTVHFTLELTRDRNAHDATPVPDPSAPANADAVMAKHAAMNDWRLATVTAPFEADAASARLPLGDREPQGLVVKAWALTPDDVHQGAIVLP